MGAETRARVSCQIPLFVYDGDGLPNQTESVDWVLFVDVLHHAVDPAVVLAEASRVARRGLVIKDHFGDSVWARRVLRAMDWFGNRHLGVDLRANYLSRSQWYSLWELNGLKIDRMDELLDLYPAPLKPLFENGLHFAARLSFG